MNDRFRFDLAHLDNPVNVSTSCFTIEQGSRGAEFGLESVVRTSTDRITQKCSKPV